MKKKSLIILAVLVLILVAGEFFWYWWDKTELDRIFADSKDYIVQETSAGKFVENRKDGLKIKLPEGWDAKPGVEMLGYRIEEIITLFHPDSNFRDSKGCAIEIEIIRLVKEKEYLIVKGVNEVKKDIEFFRGLSSEQKKSYHEEVIHINGHEALKTIFSNTIKIEVPVKKRVYVFTLGFNLKDPEKCLEDFDKLLEAVSINNN